MTEKRHRDPRSKSWRLGRGLVACLAIACLTGCAYFQKASEEECEVLYDHFVEVASDDAAEEGELGDFGGVLVKMGTDVFAEWSGEKEKMIRRCKVQMTRYAVQVCLKQKTMDDLEANCGE